MNGVEINVATKEQFIVVVESKLFENSDMQLMPTIEERVSSVEVTTDEIVDVLATIVGVQSMNDKLIKIIEKLAEKKTKEEAVLIEFKDKEKVKALTTAELLDRIERMLGIK